MFNEYFHLCRELHFSSQLQLQPAVPFIYTHLYLFQRTVMSRFWGVGLINGMYFVGTAVIYGYRVQFLGNSTDEWHIWENTAYYVASIIQKFGKLSLRKGIPSQCTCKKFLNVMSLHKELAYSTYQTFGQPSN